MGERRLRWVDASRLADRPLLHNHPSAWRISNLAWALSGFVFVGLLIPPIRTFIDNLDETINRLAVSAEWRPLVAGSEALDIIGSVWVTFPFIIAVGLWLIRQRHWEALMTWLFTMGLTQVMIGPLKGLYDRARPPVALVHTTGFSFPSGHSVTSTAVAVAAVIVLAPAGPARRNLEVLAAGFAVLMALSRVYIRAHWFSDVAAGAALGVAIAVGTAALLHEVDNRLRVHRGEEPEP